MARQRFIIILAVLSAATPFTGFPEEWKAAFITFSGAVIAALALLLEFTSREQKIEEGAPMSPDRAAPDPYVEPVSEPQQ